MIGDVVLMCEEHRVYATHRPEALYQLCCKTRIVNQYVTPLARRTRDQITPTSKTRFRGKPAKVDILIEQQRKSVNSDVRIVFFGSANRACRTGNECHHCEFRLVYCLRLVVDAALIAVVSEYSGSQLAAGIAIDAGRVNKEISRNILG